MVFVSTRLYRDKYTKDLQSTASGSEVICSDHHHLGVVELVLRNMNASLHDDSGIKAVEDCDFVAGGVKLMGGHYKTRIHFVMSGPDNPGVTRQCMGGLASRSAQQVDQAIEDLCRISSQVRRKQKLRFPDYDRWVRAGSLMAGRKNENGLVDRLFRCRVSSLTSNIAPEEALSR